MEGMSLSNPRASDSSHESEQLFFTLPDRFPNENEEKAFRLIESYDLNGLRALLADNSQVDLLEASTPDGKTALHYAVVKNDEAIVNYLLTFSVPLPHYGRASNFRGRTCACG
eukprot:TRINITY_DN10526_c0_g1_i4.p4 TRINITY_DN10526_c0_g1~~TRINITY_DN10526_c0_g1_i4.p4  ORF type:complete len:113 (+),score=24.56 TRINITY_DN10526_c0_g1_i4:174-512(+)